MEKNIELAQKLNSHGKSSSSGKVIEISPGDIDRLNELQKLKNNSYSKIKRRIKSTISLSNISSDIEEPSDGKNNISIGDELKRDISMRKKTEFEENLKENEVNQVRNDSESFKINFESNSQFKNFEKIPDLNEQMN